MFTTDLAAAAADNTPAQRATRRAAFRDSTAVGTFRPRPWDRPRLDATPVRPRRSLRTRLAAGAMS
jgi:hypothetical protein